MVRRADPWAFVKTRSKDIFISPDARLGRDGGMNPQVGRDVTARECKRLQSEYVLVSRRVSANRDHLDRSLLSVARSFDRARLTEIAKFVAEVALLFFNFLEEQKPLAYRYSQHTACAQ